jgi:hypothetical protein
MERERDKKENERERERERERREFVEGPSRVFGEKRLRVSMGTVSIRPLFRVTRSMGRGRR